MDMIQLLNRKEFAEKNGMTKVGVDYAVKSGNLTRVEFTWTDRKGYEHSGKFILPKGYALVNRSELMKVTKGISTL